METLKGILWPIVLAGGLGVFIDFLIGKAGQERAKDFLLRWWVRFDDVRWKNFGREEGLFAADIMEKWFSRKIWSLRRAILFSLLLVVNACGILILFTFVKTINPFFIWLSSDTISFSTPKFACHYCQYSISYVIVAIILVFLDSRYQFRLPYS
jgi:hypothetical protein